LYKNVALGTCVFLVVVAAFHDIIRAGDGK
jgi:hypothetical protein